MTVSNLTDWIRICRTTDMAGHEQDRGILDTGWTSGTITPPPAMEHPMARLPLERARACAEEARRAPTTSLERAHLREALRWLSLPYPGTSDLLLRAMRRERDRLQQLLDSMAH